MTMNLLQIVGQFCFQNYENCVYALTQSPMHKNILHTYIYQAVNRIILCGNPLMCLDITNKLQIILLEGSGLATCHYFDCCI